MSFSFRSLFQRDSASEEGGGIAAPAFGLAHQGTAGSRPVNMSTQSAHPMQPPAGASPFQLGGNPLFRTASNEAITAPPINSAQGMSPFNVAGATPTNAPLTVGDVISHLPPEVVRGGAVPMEQPLALPPMLLENALRSGQPALPLFELYRVCPALFQTPISPQDPRLVPLPASKLPSLIAKAREEKEGGGQMAQPGAPNERQATPPAGSGQPSPFQTARPAPGGEFNGQAPAFPMSPFAAVSPGFKSPPPPGPTAENSTPFSTPSAQPSAPSPFGTLPQREAGGADSQRPQGAANPGSPFAATNGQAPASPFGSAQPFGSPTSPPPLSPFGTAAPASAPAPQPMPSPFGMGGPAGAPAPQSPPSLFGTAAPASAPTPQSMPSPFGTGAPAGAPAPQSPPSLFGTAAPASAPAPKQMPSPFGTGAPAGAPASQSPPSLFGTAAPASAPAPQPMPSPFGAPPQGQVASPQPSITQLFSPKPQESMSPPPTGMTGFADAKFQQAAPPSGQAQPPAQTASSASGMTKLGLAALLRGKSGEELGFNPATVPAWMMTSVPAAALQQQAASGEVVMELGALIDGVIDIGFRNTLSSARRDLQIQLPQNEVFHALTQPSAARPDALQSVMTPAADSASVFQQGGNEGRIAPVQSAPAPAAESLFAKPAPPAVAAAPASHVQPVQFSPGPLSGPMAPFAPKMGAAVNPFADAASSPPAAAPTPLFSPAPAAPVQSAPQSFPAAPAASEAQSRPTSQGLAGMFKPFGAPPPNSSFGAPAAPSGSPTKPFDPFASAGEITGRVNNAPGFSSAQLLGQKAPEAPAVHSVFGGGQSAAPAPTPTVDSPPREPQPLQREAVNLEPPAAAATVAPQGLFGSAPANTNLPSPPKPKPAAESGNGKMPAVKHSFLGLAPFDTQTDQLLLRALLGTEENLTAPRVVELLATQPGLSACVCLHGSHVLSHADSENSDASEFQRQAPDIARQLRGLAPLIGIDGAETFTLNAGGRLLTFCFPGDTTVAVLHDDEPSTGLRDKITLISRELSRVLG